jgi:phosphoglycerate dehydrogenase-like enzyme
MSMSGNWSTSHRFWSDPRVLITPHITGASDRDRHGAIDLFCENLRAYLDGKPLRNVIDWDIDTLIINLAFRPG